MTQLESVLEKAVCDWVASIGGKAVKLKDVERGFPDRTILLPCGVICFVELKRPRKNKKYHMQKLWVEKLTALGFHAAFCETLEQVQDLVQRAQGPKSRSKRVDAYYRAIGGPPIA